MSRRGTRYLSTDSSWRPACLQELLRLASKAALRASRCADKLVGTVTLAGAGGGGGGGDEGDVDGSVFSFVNNDVTVSTILFAVFSNFFLKRVLMGCDEYVL